MKRRVSRARGDSLRFTLRITALDSQGAMGRYPMGHIHTAAILSRENSLRSRRLEVVGERENRRARGTVTRVSPSRAPVFSCAHYLQAPATQATRETAKALSYHPRPRSEKLGSDARQVKESYFSLSGQNGRRVT